MRDILAGGVLTQTDISGLLSLMRKPRPRRRIVRNTACRVRTGKCVAKIQPGQLVAPSLNLVFPSLALH